MRIDRTRQAESVRNPDLEVYSLCLFLQQAGCSVHEAGVYKPVVLQSLYIDLADDKLFFHREAGRLGKQVPVLGNDPVTGKDQVGTRFAEAGGGIDIAGHAAGGLLADQGTQVIVFADQFVACRQVKDDVGSFHCQ